MGPSAVRCWAGGLKGTFPSSDVGVELPVILMHPKPSDGKKLPRHGGGRGRASQSAADAAAPLQRPGCGVGRAAPAAPQPLSAWDQCESGPALAPASLLPEKFRIILVELSFLY